MLLRKKEKTKTLQKSRLPRNLLLKILKENQNKENFQTYQQLTMKTCEKKMNGGQDMDMVIIFIIIYDSNIHIQKLPTLKTDTVRTHQFYNSPQNSRKQKMKWILTHTHNGNVNAINESPFLLPINQLSFSKYANTQFSSSRKKNKIKEYTYLQIFFSFVVQLYLQTRKIEPLAKADKNEAAMQPTNSNIPMQSQLQLYYTCLLKDILLCIYKSQTKYGQFFQKIKTGKNKQKNSPRNLAIGIVCQNTANKQASKQTKNSHKGYYLLCKQQYLQLIYILTWNSEFSN
eukprot:TRINITY_DN7070_c0_g1_i1.p1 TRINITY_DN7070_c0_g1~~TRINITY_DN7070_c0_g1_i1.p1  ORF type:complete len:287 (+),score=7.00 TRINITY_DN7070_c0_g1_i1:539-1399(+)